MERIQIELKSILKSDKNPYNNQTAEKLNTLGKEDWELELVNGT